MTTEQRINKDLGECKYTLLEDHSNNKLWERTCSNNVDFIVGLRWYKTEEPTWEDFDNQKRIKNIAFRFEEKQDAEVFFKLKKIT
jgi:hypothetical protein